VVTGRGREGSTWWREIVRIHEGIGFAVGTWLVDNLRLTVGNEFATLFWLDRWVGDVPL